MSFIGNECGRNLAGLWSRTDSRTTRDPGYLINAYQVLGAIIYLNDFNPDFSNAACNKTFACDGFF